MWWRVTQHHSDIRAEAIANMSQSHNIVQTHETNTKVRDSGRHQGEWSTQGMERARGGGRGEWGVDGRSGQGKQRIESQAGSKGIERRWV